MGGRRTLGCTTLATIFVVATPTRDARAQEPGGPSGRTVPGEPVEITVRSSKQPEWFVSTKAATGISENEIREDDTPMGRAKKMQQLMAFGHGEASLSVIFGCSAQTVRNNLALLECCADVRKAVDNGKINVSHARALSKLEPADQKDKLALLVEAGEGVKGHEKTKKQREALVGSSDKPKVRSRKEIQAAIGATNPADEFASWRDALRWALGEELA